MGGEKKKYVEKPKHVQYFFHYNIRWWFFYRKILSMLAFFLGKICNRTC